MSEAILKPVHMFYWQAEFADGYKLSQFDSQGNEVFIKDICGLECLRDIHDPTKGYNVDSNLLGRQEASHGNVTKFSWLPFTEELKDAIEKKGEIEIQILENPRPIEIDIPNDCYAHFYRSTKIEEDTKFIINEKKQLLTEVVARRAYVGKLFLGFFPREGSSRRPVINEINLREVYNA